MITALVIINMPGPRHHMYMETAPREVDMLRKDTQRSVAIRIGVSQRAMWNVSERYQETGSVARRYGSRRSRATTAQEDRYIRLIAHRERTITTRTLQN